MTFDEQLLKNTLEGPDTWERFLWLMAEINNSPTAQEYVEIALSNPSNIAKELHMTVALFSAMKAGAIAGFQMGLRERS